MTVGIYNCKKIFHYYSPTRRRSYTCEDVRTRIKFCLRRNWKSRKSSQVHTTLIIHTTRGYSTACPNGKVQLGFVKISRKLIPTYSSAAAAANQRRTKKSRLPGIRRYIMIVYYVHHGTILGEETKRY